MKELSEKWQKRIALATEADSADTEHEGLTYDELSTLWEMPRSSVPPQISRLPSGLCSKGKDGRKVRVSFSTGGSAEAVFYPKAPVELEPIDMFDVPPDVPGIKDDTHGNVVVKLLAYAVDIGTDKMNYQPLPDWKPEFQRGGLAVLITEMGQKVPYLKVTFRIDNGYVVASVATVP